MAHPSPRLHRMLFLEHGKFQPWQTVPEIPCKLVGVSASLRAVARNTCCSSEIWSIKMLLSLETRACWTRLDTQNTSRQCAHRRERCRCDYFAFSRCKHHVLAELSRFRWFKLPQFQRSVLAKCWNNVEQRDRLDGFSPRVRTRVS